MGKEGLKEVARLCLQKSHYLARAIEGIEGFRLRYGAAFFKEFVVETPVPAAVIVAALAEDGVLAGVDLAPYGSQLTKSLLIAVTEKRTKSDMDRLVSLLDREW